MYLGTSSSSESEPESSAYNARPLTFTRPVSTSRALSLKVDSSVKSTLEFDREYCIDNLLARIRSVIEMIRWTGLARIQSLLCGNRSVYKARPFTFTRPVSTSRALSLQVNPQI